MKYNALGTLISYRHMYENRYVILVKYGNEFVVSLYINGESSWVDGSYFRDRDRAENCFDLKCNRFRKEAQEC